MSTDDRSLRLSHASVTATLEPKRGARITSVCVAGAELLGASRDPHVPPAMRDGCFAMAPFAGRIHRGSFQWAGREWQLPVNLGDSAAHGVSFDVAWETDSLSATTAECVCELDRRWPFGGVVRQRVTVHEEGVLIEVSLENDRRSMPAMLGLHPWFARRQGESVAQVAVELGDSPGFVGAESGGPPERPWDHCIVGLPASPTAWWPCEEGAPSRQLMLESSTSIWVVSERDPDAFCLEPVTGPLGSLGEPDGPVVEPGVPLRLAFHVCLVEGPGGEA